MPFLEVRFAHSLRPGTKRSSSSGPCPRPSAACSSRQTRVNSNNSFGALEASDFGGFRTLSRRMYTGITCRCIRIRTAPRARRACCGHPSSDKFRQSPCARFGASLMPSTNCIPLKRCTSRSPATPVPYSFQQRQRAKSKRIESFFGRGSLPGIPVQILRREIRRRRILPRASGIVAAERAFHQTQCRRCAPLVQQSPSPWRISPSWCAARRSARCGRLFRMPPPSRRRRPRCATSASRNRRPCRRPAHRPPPVYASGRARRRGWRRYPLSSSSSW